jgi:hypothetical protein
VRVRGDLAVLVPSRGRPAAVAGLASSICATAAGATALIVAVDLDDPASTDYPPVAAGAPNLPGLLVLERTASAGQALNLIAARYAPAARHLLFLPDGLRPVTPGWDTALCAALDAGAGMARGREGTAEPLPRHVAVRAAVVQTLGYLVPPGVPTTAWADVWAGWGKACGMAEVGAGAVFDRDPAVPLRARSPEGGLAEWARYRRSGQAERDEQALAALAAGGWAGGRAVVAG